MSGKVFKGEPEQLQSKERQQLLEIERVIELSLEGTYTTKVLDVGTGTGLFAEAFALRHLQVEGVDINPEMIRAATKRVYNVKFTEAPAEKLPFVNDSFDIVFMSHVLHESEDPVLALKEAARVACSRIAILEWPHREEKIGPPLSHRLSYEDVKSIAAKAGLKKIDTTMLDHMVLYRFTLTKSHTEEPETARPRKTKKKTSK